MFKQLVRLLPRSARYIKKLASDQLLKPLEYKRRKKYEMTESPQFLELSEEKRELVIKEIKSLLKERKELQQTIKKDQEQTNTANEQLFLELLGVFDTLEFLLNYLGDNPEPSPKFIQRLPKQLEVLQSKLLGVLERRQVDPIDDLTNTKPDFSLCVVVDREVRHDIEDQTITKVVKKGFRIQNRILRPVEVITSKYEP